MARRDGTVDRDDHNLRMATLTTAIGHAFAGNRNFGELDRLCREMDWELRQCARYGCPGHEYAR